MIRLSKYSYENKTTCVFSFCLFSFEEWALQCECDLEISDEMYQMIDNYAERRHSSSIDVTKNGLSAILIKGRNAKFGVIK